MADMIAHYRIVSKIGEGGMGQVFLAEDTKLGRKVAMKLLFPDAPSDEVRRKRFLQEARAACALAHPNICVVYQADETSDGRPYIAMEYVEGTSLGEKVRETPLPVPDILDLGIQIADALRAAHEKGIIHRDIKPGNVLVTSHGQVKVVDFGLAKFTCAAGPLNERPSESLTASGMVVGTVPYMSPDQLLGKTVDYRTDIFSLGVLLYEMSTGRRPFSGATEAGTIDEIIHRGPVPPRVWNPALPADLEAAIGRALEKDRDLRYQTASDLGADLKRIRRDTSSEKVGPVNPPASSALSRRPARRYVWPAVAALAVVAITSWFVANRFNRDFPPMPARRQLAILAFGGPGDDADIAALREGFRAYLDLKVSQFSPGGGALLLDRIWSLSQEGVATAEDAHRILGTTMVLQGDLDRKGDLLAVCLRLVRAADGQLLKPPVSVEDRLANLSVFQDELVFRTADMLNVAVDSEARRSFSEGGTSTPAAIPWTEPRSFSCRRPAKTRVTLFPRGGWAVCIGASSSIPRTHSGRSGLSIPWSARPGRATNSLLCI